ncbi:MAG: DUF1134 domain-containing protein [Pseudomonadota bacterium]
MIIHRFRVLMSALVMSVLAAVLPAQAQTQATDATFSSDEIVDAGHAFFGTVSKNLAGVVENLFANYGRPNGYILGEEASGAFVGGIRYGEGQLVTKNAGSHPVFWQGPSVGFDWGADGARTMILVYNLPSVDNVYRRFVGVSGSAFVVGGLGVTALTNEVVTLVPIRTGVGARIGANVGYLKLRKNPTWNPF